MFYGVNLRMWAHRDDVDQGAGVVRYFAVTEKDAKGAWSVIFRITLPQRLSVWARVALPFVSM